MWWQSERVGLSTGLGEDTECGGHSLCNTHTQEETGEGSILPTRCFPALGSPVRLSELRQALNLP